MDEIRRTMTEKEHFADDDVGPAALNWDALQAKAARTKLEEIQKRRKGNEEAAQQTRGCRKAAAGHGRAAHLARAAGPMRVR